MKGLLLSIMIAVAQAAAGVEDSFAGANADYDAGKFAEARRGYDRVLSEGWRANVLFNHGNASFRLDEPGRAALAWERALMLEPWHPEAQANLKFVRNKRSARVAESAREEKARRFAMLPLTCWFFIAAGWAGVLMAGVALWRRRRGALFWGGALAFVFGAAGIAGVWRLQKEARQFAIVVADGGEARSEPADRATLVEALPQASRVRILSVQGDWTYCELPGGRRGWIESGKIERVLPAAGA